MRKFFLLSIFSLLFFSHSFSSDLKYLENFLKKFSGIKTFQVNFIQIYRSSLNEDSEEGILYYKRNMKFCWKYVKPERKEFLLIGKRAFFYVPSDSQVVVSSVDRSDFENSIFKIFESKDLKELDKQYIIDYVGERDGAYSYFFSPCKDVEVKNFSIFINGKTFMPEKIFLRNFDGSENIFIFSNYKLNIKLKDSIFKPNFPEGTEIIYEE